MYNSNYNSNYNSSYNSGYSNQTAGQTAGNVLPPETDIIGWDSKPVYGNEFVVLNPGVYPYKITSVEKSNFPGNANIGACPITIIHLEITSPQGTAKLDDRIFMIKKNEWRVHQLMESIGLPKQQDGSIVPDWNKVEGASGICLIENKPGSKNPSALFNSLKKYLPPER